jgi:glycolate oxidase FAD binding subunit
MRFGGAAAMDQARAAADRLDQAGLEGADVVGDDDDLWAGQRAGQRDPDGAVVKVAGVMSDLPVVLRAAQAAGGTMVGRAALGLSWIALPGGGDLGGRVRHLREALDGCATTVLDGAGSVPDPWPAPDPGALAVMERIKARFDPARVFRPGAFVGGI